jgi:hypothetical protein
MMKIIDPGHEYDLTIYDGNDSESQTLKFMKREGIGYPGNVGSHPGTNCQEVLRVLINRSLYLNNQFPCWETTAAVESMRIALMLFELRSARRHGRELAYTDVEIELAPTCSTCGHIHARRDHRG